ncbi:sensor histidine kinase [Bacillus sp. FJAT-47783]|uniref:sensor histidine kinase n=1 Tax=Bacillus sp. FJAT-47783 TaxID=2922712 RepID=UPI001FAC0323|nr:sensor histidine kinase [Bacillus sp. FJAT-47783]
MLYSFMIRFAMFSCLWVGYLWSEWHSLQHVTIAFFTCTIILTSYFLLPLVKNKFPLYIFMVIAMFLTDFFIFSSQNAYVELLILFLFLNAVEHLKMKAFTVLLIFSAVITTVLLYYDGLWKMEWIIGFMFFYIISYLTNLYFHRYEENKVLYEELLSEYRHLKRMQFENGRVTRLEERTRIARDIHDSVGHKLTALLMQIEILREHDSTGAFTIIKQLAKESLEETRLAVRSLKAEEVEGIASVIHLIRKLELESHINVHFTTKKGVLTIPLTNKESVVLYRVIQEALTNAMRHGSTREVFVTLSINAIGELQFLIENDISEPTVFKEGFGLTNLRKRVEELHGKVTIYQTDQRFIIRGTFPKNERI